MRFELVWRCVLYGNHVRRSRAGIVRDGKAMDLGMYNHVPGGANVLHFDGHVEWIRQNERYPVPRLVDSTGAYIYLGGSMGDLLNGLLHSPTEPSY